MYVDICMCVQPNYLGVHGVTQTERTGNLSAVIMSLQLYTAMSLWCPGVLLCSLGEGQHLASAFSASSFHRTKQWLQPTDVRSFFLSVIIQPFSRFLRTHMIVETQRKQVFSEPAISISLPPRNSDPESAWLSLKYLPITTTEKRPCSHSLKRRH